MITFLITVVAVITVHGYHQHPRKAALTTYNPGLEKPAPDTSPSIPPLHPTDTKGFPNTFTLGDIPKPGRSDVVIRPFLRCGAPSAVLTVT
jgi:hypothetical protein